MRLHHRMTFVGGAIGLVELHLGARVGGVEIAQRLPVGLAVTPLASGADGARAGKSKRPLLRS